MKNDYISIEEKGNSGIENVSCVAFKPEEYWAKGFVHLNEWSLCFEFEPGRYPAEKLADAEKHHQVNKAAPRENLPGLDRSCKFPDGLVNIGKPLSVEESNMFLIRLRKAKEEFDDIQCETKKSEEKELCTRVIRDIGLLHCGRLRFWPNVLAWSLRKEALPTEDFNWLGMFPWQSVHCQRGKPILICWIENHSKRFNIRNKLKKT